MNTASPSTPSRLGDEHGFTLVELLVAVALMLIIVAAAMGLLVTSNNSQPRISKRASALQQGRVLTERITRELRQGVGVATTPTASTLSLLTYVGHSACGSSQVGAARQCRVTYSCATNGICTRTERNPDGTGTAPAVRVAEGLRSNAVFSYQPTTVNPTFVGIRLEYPAADGEEAVTFDDGVALRNVPVTTP
jgi:prepilin-type N-terminal cleavage/methylation domain-containing protein